MRVLALASYDSFVNVARLLAPHFERQGCVVEFALVKARAKTQISPEQITRLGLDGIARWVSIESICTDGELSKFDIVLCCLEGASTRRLLHYVGQLEQNRPLLISLYPGLLIRHQYDGYSMRTGSDLVWLNCEADREAFLRMCDAFGLPSDNVRLFGIPSLLHHIVRKPDADRGPVVFFEQAVIPRYQDERLFLASQLIKLARANTDYEFLIKARTTGSDATLHQTWHPIDELLNEVAEANGGWPENLKLTSDSASELLASASHCLTISSTVAVEAINAGIPTAIVGDFGAQEDYGLSYFFESGLIRPLSDISFPFRGRPNDEWLARYVAAPDETVVSMVKEAVELAKQPLQSMRERPTVAEMSLALRGFLIERNGIENVLSRSYQSRKKAEPVPNNPAPKRSNLLSRLTTILRITSRRRSHVDRNVK